MKFIFLKGEYNQWFELDLENLRCYNINGGHFYINENSSEYINAIVRDFNSWYDLYKETGFDPLVSSYPTRICWLDPDGKYYPSDAHLVDADKITRTLYNFNKYDSFIHRESEDFLLDNGWIKLSATAMLKIYEDQGMYNNLSILQIKSIQKWASNYGIICRTSGNKISFY